MVAPAFDRCPVCGEIHHLPGVRSTSPYQMGCREVLGEDVWMFNHERCMLCGEYTEECKCGESTV